jgi:hypothetical protein
LTFDWFNIDFLSCLENLGILNHISELNTLLRKPSHAHALLELRFLLKNVFLQGNFCAYWFLTLNYILVYFWNANWTGISALYTCVFWKLFGKYFSALFPLFQIFCVKRLDGVTGCPDCPPGCPDGDSGFPDDKVDSSKRPFFLSWRVCLCDLLRGITSGRHLSSVRTVNPVGLNRNFPGAAHHFLLSFCLICRLVLFPCDFYAFFLRARVLFEIYLLPRYVCLFYYCFILRFYA